MTPSGMSFPASRVVLVIKSEAGKVCFGEPSLSPHPPDSQHDSVLKVLSFDEHAPQRYSVNMRRENE